LRSLASLIIPLALGALLYSFRAPLLAGFMGSQIQNYSKRYQQHNPEVFLEANLESILKDRKILEKVSFFSLGSSGQGDASHVLNALLLKNDEKAMPLPRQLHERLEEAKDWTQLRWAELPILADTSWLTSLQGFDHWNFDLSLTQNNPLPTQPWDMKRSNLKPLLHWLKLHYIQAKQKNDIIQALGDGRHLARLLSTTDTSVGIDFALEVLQLENEFLSSLSEDNKVGLSWAPIGPEAIKAAQRYFNHMGKYLDERLSNESFLIFFNHPVGKCAIVQAALHRHLEVRHHPKKHLFAQGLDRLHQAIELSQRGCRSGLLRKIWKAEQNPFPNMAFLPDGAGFVWDFFKKQLRKENLQRYPDLVLAFYYLTWSQSQKKSYELQRNDPH